MSTRSTNHYVIDIKNKRRVSNLIVLLLYRNILATNYRGGNDNTKRFPLIFSKLF